MPASSASAEPDNSLSQMASASGPEIGSQMLERTRTSWTACGWAEITSSIRYSPMLPRSMARSVTSRCGSELSSICNADRQNPATHPSVLFASTSTCEADRWMSCAANSCSTSGLVIASSAARISDRFPCRRYRCKRHDRVTQRRHHHPQIRRRMPQHRVQTGDHLRVTQMMHIVQDQNQDIVGLARRLSQLIGGVFGQGPTGVAE